MTDRIEVEASSPLTAISAARRLLPETAEIVGWRLAEEISPSSPLPQRSTSWKALLARILWPFSK
jgi:hypothetical protein